MEPRCVFPLVGHDLVFTNFHHGLVPDLVALRAALAGLGSPSAWDFGHCSFDGCACGKMVAFDLAITPCRVAPDQVAPAPSCPFLGLHGRGRWYSDGCSV
eukprot:5668723-Heterocapsa_arctica.AAC.1